MPGRMGGDRVTTSNVRIAQIDQANNILYISGAVPGARNSVVLVYGEGDLKIAQPKVEIVEEKKPEVKTEVVAEAKTIVKPEVAAETKTAEIKKTEKK